MTEKIKLIYVTSCTSLILCLFALIAVVSTSQNNIAHRSVVSFGAEETCDYTTQYMSNLICKDIPPVPPTPQQELARQIVMVNDITNRPMPRSRVNHIANELINECPEYALDIYLIGVPESYNWNRSQYEGDFRIQYEDGEPCADCTCTHDGCFSRESCDPNEVENCVATSCGPFHIRPIYRDFSCEDLKDERFSIEWMCNWMVNNYPNIAAHNAGVRGASTHAGADDYGYRHFLLKELVTSDHVHEIDDWGWGRNELSSNRIVYLPPIIE